MVYRNEEEKKGKEGKRPALLSRELLFRLKGKKQMHRQCELGQVTWKEFRDAVLLCRDKVRKAKAKPELNLAGDAKIDKSFYRCVKQSEREYLQ